MAKKQEDDEDETEEKHSRKYNKKSNNLLWIILGVILVIGIIFAIVHFQVDNANNQNSQANTSTKSCKDVQVPYQDTEQYTEQEPYQDIETYTTYLQSQVISATSEERFNFQLGQYAYAQIQLKNIDNQAGWFMVTFNWNKFNANWQDAVRHYITPDQTIQFESIYDIDAGEKWSITYGYISDPVENTRQVTKYRDVVKTREVTKYKTEQQCD